MSEDRYCTVCVQCRGEQGATKCAIVGSAIGANQTPIKLFLAPLKPLLVPLRDTLYLCGPFSDSRAPGPSNWSQNPCLTLSEACALYDTLA